MFINCASRVSLSIINLLKVHVVLTSESKIINVTISKQFPQTPRKREKKQNQPEAPARNSVIAASFVKIRSIIHGEMVCSTDRGSDSPARRLPTPQPPPTDRWQRRPAVGNHNSFLFGKTKFANRAAIWPAICISRMELIVTKF